jgi:hypothetical protein
MPTVLGSRKQGSPHAVRTAGEIMRGDPMTRRWRKAFRPVRRLPRWRFDVRTQRAGRHLPPAGPISRRATSRRGHLERSVPALSDALLAIGGTAKPAFRELRLRFDWLAGCHSLSDTGDTPLTPMACAAAGLKSITRPRTNGPRSLMRTTTERPV